MKRIKTYKIFESDDLRKYHGDKIIDECDEQIEVIKDLLLELSDKDYTCKVGYTMRDIAMRMSWKPVIDISITKLTTSDLLDGYRPDGAIIANPLYNNDDEKMDFDAVILDILRYGVSEGYKYKCEEIKSYSKEKIIRYSIYLYKEKITTYK
jgi:hypothetical protein